MEQKVNVFYLKVYLYKSVFSNRNVMTEKLNLCMLPMKSYMHQWYYSFLSSHHKVILNSPWKKNRTSFIWIKTKHIARCWSRKVPESFDLLFVSPFFFNRHRVKTWNFYSSRIRKSFWVLSFWVGIELRLYFKRVQFLYSLVLKKVTFSVDILKDMLKNILDGNNDKL